MASFNRVILIGNLTRDVELKYLPSGMAVTELGLAVNDRRKGQNGEWVDEAVFVDVTLWGRTAEIAAEYVSKGSPLFVEGRLKYDSWEKDGKKFSKLRVVGERIQLLGTKSGSGGRPTTPHQPEEVSYAASVGSEFGSAGSRMSGAGGANEGMGSGAMNGPESHGDPVGPSGDDPDVPF